MVKNNVWSIVILFNPDIERLQSLVHHLMLQNSNIVLVNNGTKHRFISDLINEQVFLIQLEDNLGIAKAQNIGIVFAKNKNAKGIFLFDQDSKVSNNFISAMLKAKITSSVGMIVPNVLDVNTNKYLEPRIYNRKNSKITVKFPKNKNIEGPTRKAAKPIASGSYIFMDALMQVGGMREKFFIDAVDTDFSYRLIERGYDIFRINDVHLVHPVGNKIERDFFGKRIFLSNHSSKRRYYIGRNNIWLWKIHFGKINGITKDVFITLASQLLYSLLEKSSISKTSHLIWGILGGLISSPKEFVREIK